MDLTTGQYIQLIVGLAAVTIMFVMAYIGSEKPIIYFLVLLIPFQPVVSKFGSLNTGLSLLIFIAFILNKRIARLPFFGLIMLVLFVYMLSLSQAPIPTYKDHLFYLVSISANVSVFYIIFNYVVRTEDIEGVVKMMIWMNFLVVVYSLVQMVMGTGSSSAISIGDISFKENRQDARLAGPFNAVGITAEYMVIQVYMVLYRFFYVNSRKEKMFLLLLIMLNMGVMVGTGNRTAIIVTIIAALIFFALFKRQLGSLRLIKLGSVAALLFVVASSLMIAFTDFNVLFDRFSETGADEEKVLDSRSVIWPLAIERIQEEPLIGHGPRIRLIEESERRINGHEFMPYPHSLYLYVVYTIGFIGLFVLAISFLVLFRLFSSGLNSRHKDTFIRGMPRLAILILIIIMIDQMKVSMMRFSLTDYQQYVAAILGLLVGATHVAKYQRNQVEPDNESNLQQETKRI
ncbi:MAG: O-antigen ligase family protein [Methylococcales bacterium]